MRTAYRKLLKIFLIVPVLITLGVVDGAAGMANNPCSKNPCMARNPCAAENIPIRKNPIKDPARLKKMGEKLWGDTALGTSGMACGTCHPNGAGLKKEPYPKHIKMTGDIVTMDQMINFCMVNPMKGKPLAWNSQEMTALAAYITANSRESAAPMNPCSMKNPCNAKNPCGMKNPCGTR
jgi:cytochrome c peroxidase